MSSKKRNKKKKEETLRVVEGDSDFSETGGIYYCNICNNGKEYPSMSALKKHKHNH
jgi:hypothetical protein